MERKRIAICTISSNNYIPYGLTCILSAKEHNPNADYYYLIADEFKKELYSNDNRKGIKFISLDEIGIEKLEILNLSFKYNIVEFNTSVKPIFYEYLFKLGYDSVIYLDPDTECYDSFDTFLSRNRNYSIIVTPHKTTSVESDFIKDKVFLNNGIYNLGFVAMNKSDSTSKFLKWWSIKLKNNCFIDYADGLATDQIWVELASTIFDGFYVDKDCGLNVAFWNIHERLLTSIGGRYYVNDTPLIFFHFSSLSANCKKDFLEKIESLNHEFSELYNQHINKVIANGLDRYSIVPYAFSYFDNGEPITKEERWLYGFSNKLQDKYINPYSTRGKCFYKEIRGNELEMERKNLSGIDYKIAWFLKFIGIKRGIYFGERFGEQMSIAFVKHIAKLCDKD